MDEVDCHFSGERLTTHPQVGGARLIKVNHYGNSGAAAISIAVKRGAQRIGLIGYDCRTTHKTHWHGDHPKPLRNAGSLPKWPLQFQQLADNCRHLEVMNCTPGTVLKCFPAQTLDEFLCAA